MSVFNTTKFQNEVVLGLDIPYIFNSKWRVRMEGIYENDPNMLYFGVSEKSLATLVNQQTNTSYNNYTSYDKSLSDNYKNYNRFTEKINIMINLSAERSFFKSKMRSIFGFRYANMNVNPYSGYSLLQNDFLTGNAFGVGYTTVTMLQPCRQCTFL